jgi:Polyphosphate kinase N-terminal domain
MLRCRQMTELGQITPESSAALINRELSWLSFARRVLALAEDSGQPLLERVKFAGITGMIYDEFAMKRTGGLLRQTRKGWAKRGPDGLPRLKCSRPAVLSRGPSSSDYLLRHPAPGESRRAAQEAFIKRSASALQLRSPCVRD